MPSCGSSNSLSMPLVQSQCRPHHTDIASDCVQKHSWCMCSGVNLLWVSWEHSCLSNTSFTISCTPNLMGDTQHTNISYLCFYFWHKQMAERAANLSLLQSHKCILITQRPRDVFFVWPLCYLFFFPVLLLEMTQEIDEIANGLQGLFRNQC